MYFFTIQFPRQPIIFFVQWKGDFNNPKHLSFVPSALLFSQEQDKRIEHSANKLYTSFLLLVFFYPKNNLSQCMREQYISYRITSFSYVLSLIWISPKYSYSMYSIHFSFFLIRQALSEKC